MTGHDSGMAPCILFIMCIGRLDSIPLHLQPLPKKLHFLTLLFPMCTFYMRQENVRQTYSDIKRQWQAAGGVMSLWD